jgi:hypothetical protein
MMRQSYLAVTFALIALPAMGQTPLPPQGHDAPPASAQPAPETPRERALEAILQNTRNQFDGQVAETIRAGDQIKQMQTTAAAQAKLVDDLTKVKGDQEAQIKDLTAKLAAAIKDAADEKMTNAGQAKALEDARKQTENLQATIREERGGKR